MFIEQVYINLSDKIIVFFKKKEEKQREMKFTRTSALEQRMSRSMRAAVLSDVDADTVAALVAFARLLCTLTSAVKAFAAAGADETNT